MVRTYSLMYCFNFFRNQLWQHLISYNSFRNINICLLEVAIFEKCRSSHFQSERGVKSLRTRGLPILEGGAGVLLLGRGWESVPHYIPWSLVSATFPNTVLFCRYSSRIFRVFLTSYNNYIICGTSLLQEMCQWLLVESVMVNHLKLLW